MKNLTVTKKVNIEAYFTREDWGLFDMPNVENVVDGLNRTLEFYVNTGFRRDIIENVMDVHMQAYAQYGAYDTEPRDFLRAVLDKIYA
jgi:hypothetical protein